MRSIRLFTWLGVTVTIGAGGIVSFLVLIPILGRLASEWLGLDLTAAAAAGALSVLVMFVSECLHQFGHALAARRTGYPMTGVHFSSFLAASLYPPDEPELPAALHIQRALGGFGVNMIIGLLLVPYAFFAWVQGGVAGWVLAFTAFYNFGVLGVGALVPINLPGILVNDGATLLKYWGKR